MIEAHYRQVRARSLALAAPLSDEDCAAQSMADASPVKWHLAHTTWFFETFVLERHEAGFRPFHPAFRMLFNSYYNGVGERHPRAARGLLTRPSMAEVRAYRADVDQRMLTLLNVQGDSDAALVQLASLGLQHEQQHQELMLTDVLHLLSANPLLPAYDSAAPQAAARPGAMEWCSFDGGLVEIGHEGDGFCFDNELPRHRQYLAPYQLATRLVSNGDFLAFMDDGGYRNPALWLAEGWDVVCRERLSHPLYWRYDDNDGWRKFSLRGEQSLDLAQPACHLSLYEAAACAAWMGARLPTEGEWEAGAASPGLDDLSGPCWQWTSSSYAPYPGYASAPGALGEYNGKFMLNQYVLRGASLATPEGHARRSYRNFFPAATRWQFTGVRLAR
ncbi:ergothioneine biosynthesis protein EgtB [Massilia sp. PAMC28688]|uniref:ergothioneine biosynthesis protein EgtB n=1 Tax=Massilia sp. PAMC28688 TaxID=2861283 RepID=UPI001C62B092|nr:ergothioneine biosynthesis protein EgtB [Massilia sp. PAMC28688]QYF96227.1 ergothioneine biosynthesis protein EgtB [Massilia sp. PAMC28688]